MRILLTGGAGFIGSHIADALLADPNVEKLTVLDNLATGFLSNIGHLSGHPRFSFINGDIRSIDECRNAMQDCDVICHQAALGSVPRSIKDPVTSNNVNANGFLNLLQAAREEGISKIVYASSSSVYGDSPELPKREEKVGTPLSPYAVTKKIKELYADVFAKQFGMSITGFRYFNVFGPRQTPEGAYAAVIPLFFKSALTNQSPLINGDGSNSRDFTYVDNVVKANLLAIKQKGGDGEHHIYNIACGETTTLNELWDIIAGLTHSTTTPHYGPPRAGDIPHSLADIQAATTGLGYNDLILLREGLRRSAEWYQANV